MPDGSEKFVPLDFEEILYPTPKMRIENPRNTLFNRGDVVKIEIGSATGKIGIVVVERNANYKDFEPYSGDESIGVRVAEESPEDPILKEIIDDLTARSTSIRTVVRWFDDNKQLTLIQKTE